jgi:CBS domain-containing protein
VVAVDHEAGGFLGVVGDRDELDVVGRDQCLPFERRDPVEERAPELLSEQDDREVEDLLGLDQRERL